MVSHFSNKDDVEKKFSLRYILSSNRVLSPAEKRFRAHGYARAALLFTGLFYFIYCNPEYCYEYSSMRKAFGWDDDDSIFPKYFKIQVKPCSLENNTSPNLLTQCNLEKQVSTNK
ncbi:unnamed protein product [Phytomonas sp. Hart1]|nr:unnamed protein product [Phytomonas sp. Hart1]|eukprot:CCW69553.1 unnamed protein product [Phytomonas sp. isolate Hart1]